VVHWGRRDCRCPLMIGVVCRSSRRPKTIRTRKSGLGADDRDGNLWSLSFQRKLAHIRNFLASCGFANIDQLAHFHKHSSWVKDHPDGITELEPIFAHTPYLENAAGLNTFLNDLELNQQSSFDHEKEKSRFLQPNSNSRLFSLN
jgi:hypothetical protein